MIFEINKELEKLLKGKRVALVGPSPHLLGKGCGSKIDKFDFVCRVNDVVERKFGADYGFRNDVIFHSCPTLWIENFSRKLERDKKTTQNIKFVVCPAIRAIHDGSGSVIENFNKINKYDIPFWWIGQQNYHYLSNQVGVEPNSGIMAAMILLNHGVKELLISGFSFYMQYNKRKTYSDCYYSKDDYSPHTAAPGTSPLLGHQQPPQTNFFVNKLIPRYKEKIIVDSFLNKLLSLNHNKVMMAN